MSSIAKPIGVFLVWNLLVGSLLLLLHPLAALPAALLLSGALLWGYLLRTRKGFEPETRWATLRLRPLTGEALRWTLIAVPVLLVLSWAMGDLYTRFVPVPPESLNPFQEILATWEGRLTISMFAIAVAPIIEEFVFRGLIQKRLERRHGPILGIAGSAGLFAIVHLLPWVFPLHFFLGVAFGFVVWATRSIWAGVILHAANNTAAMIGFALSGEEPTPTGTLWEIGITPDLWLTLLTFFAALAVAGWTATKLHQAGRSAALPTA